MDELEEKLTESLSEAEKTLAEKANTAEVTLKRAISAQEALKASAANIERLSAALGALRGEAQTTEASPAPSGGPPAPPRPADLPPPRIGGPTDPNDPLANRSTDWGDAPEPAKAGPGGIVQGLHTEEGYKAAPQQTIVDHRGQPTKFRKDDPQALAKAYQQDSRGKWNPAGEKCPGCGKVGTVVQYRRETKSGLTRNFIGCTSCNMERPG